MGDKKNATSEERAPASGPQRGNVPFLENLHSPATAEDSPFAQVADHLRRQRRIECPAGCTRWEYHRLGELRKLVTIAARCECGRVERNLRMPWDDFVKQAESVLHWERSEPRDRSADSGNASDDS